MVVYALIRSVEFARQLALLFFFFSSRRRHTRFKCDWSSDVCSSDLAEKKRTARANDGGFEVMKTRLSSTIWLLVIWNSVALFAVLGLAYAAGAQSWGVSLFQGSVSTRPGSALLLGTGVSDFTALALFFT